MTKKEIITEKTGRYFILGTSSDKIKEIWFVCHGYGQLSDSFLKDFEIINNDENLFVAPEGLHRFYLSRFSGEIGASWMTKEDREIDIKDYTYFLTKVYTDAMKGLAISKIKINAFGFSQGAAAVCRWITAQECKIDNLILWGGRVPPDIDYLKFKNRLGSAKLYIVVGQMDKFIDKEKIINEESVLKKHGIPYRLIQYNGAHEIKKDVLTSVNELMRNE